MTLHLQGRYELELVRRGQVIHRQKGRNLVTTVGEELACGRFAATGPPAAIDWIALGTSSTPPLKSDVALVAEIAASKTAATDDVVSTNQVTYTFAVAGPGAGTWNVREAGLFNNVAPATGVMAARWLTQPFTMQSGDILNVTWTLEFLGED